MNIRFIKIAKYGALIPIELKYKFYCKSTRGVINPNIDMPISYRSMYEKELFGFIYSSPLLRAKSSARYLSKRVTVLHQLSEIRFDLKSLVSQDEYLINGSALVRKRFVEAFIKDELGESRNQIITRVSDLVKLLSKAGNNDITCVSHSFLMKVIEAHLRGFDLERFPESISEFINPDHKTYEFGGGFNINVQSTRGDI